MAKDSKFTKEVESKFATPWKPTEVGQVFEGVYLGSEEIDDPRGIIDTKTGVVRTFTSYHFQTKTGIFAVAGATLANRMMQIPRGTEVQLTYLGKVKMKNGDAHEFKVLVASNADLLDPYALEEAANGAPRGEIPLSA